MYRLLKIRSLKLQNACKTSTVQYLPRTCLFCNFCHRCGNTPTPSNHSQMRHSSTVNTVILSSVGKRKFKRRANKKFAELLEVTDSTTNNRKASVQNLNAAQLSILVDQPDISLDKLHKIKNQQLLKNNKAESKSFYSTISSDFPTKEHLSNISGAEFSNFPEKFTPTTVTSFKTENQAFAEEMYEEDESLVEDLKSSGIVDESLLIKSKTFAKYINNECDEGQNERDKIIDVKSNKASYLQNSEKNLINEEPKVINEHYCEDKIKQYNKIALAYVSVCLNTSESGLENKLLDSVRHYSKKSTRLRSLRVTDINVYNLKIEKLASKSNLKEILDLVQQIRVQNIKLNHQTYAYIYECVGRADNKEQLKLAVAKEIYKEMVKDKITLNDVVTKSKFVNDQRSFVEGVINLLDEHFEPNFKLPETQYDCRLLENILHDSATPASTVDNMLNINDLENRLKKQIKMELDGQILVKNIAIPDKEHSQTVNHWRNKLSSLEKSWEKVALNAFKRNLAALKAQESFKVKSNMAMYPYLSILKPEEYVRILMREVQKIAMGSEMYSLPLYTLSRDLGMQVYNMFEAQLKQNRGITTKTCEVYLKYCDWFLKRDDKQNIRMKWVALEYEANKSGISLDGSVPKWPSNIVTNVGRFLFKILVNDLKLETNFIKKKKSHGHGHGHYVPAFFQIFRHSGTRIKEEIKPHPIVAKLYRDSQPKTLTFQTTLVPLLCPPKPWVSLNNGGYLVTETDLVRGNFRGDYQMERLIETPQNKLFPPLDSLNQLGSIPWAINSPVLDVAIEVFQNNGSEKLNMPQPPSVLSPIYPPAKDCDPKEKKKIEKERMELKRKKSEMYSLWCDALYRLSLANHFRNEIFWLPHNMDFRGRVYPVPPHLNHLGSDLARSMLVFALKKPLGPKGLDWLKIHTINLTGFKKKESIQDRLNYANEVLDEILDSAEKPLTGNMWWSKSDEPWQTLSACMEVATALKSPNPEEYMTGFPIHQDGSCNGLQHYAALGRDKIGAMSVNLCASNKPQDVYSSIAIMVNERRKTDAANGNQVAKVLDGFIHRKVIKQTVMTTVYGVTWFGAKLQIARQLKDIENFPEEYVWQASTYLATKTFETLRTMFKSAREIQDWFTECAKLICMVRGANIEWVTPLGLPVVQPYTKAMTKDFKKSQTSSLFLNQSNWRPNLMKQKNAFAPNFVHSLDSTHMMLTSIHCELAGITYVSVHDCYWTHPCTVEIMNKICREQFVALHSEPILDDLSKFFMEKFAFNDLIDDAKQDDKKNMLSVKKRLNATLSKVPQKGDFDLNSVLESTFFFS